MTYPHQRYVYITIRHEYTAPYSPEQNGIAERMNQTIQECVVSMLQHSGLSNGFWAEALLTAIHIINMSPSRPLGLQTPQQLRTGSKPNYDKLRIFGCEAYASYRKTTAGNSNQDLGNVFSLAMGQTARSDTDSRTSCWEWRRPPVRKRSHNNLFLRKNLRIADMK